MKILLVVFNYFLVVNFVESIEESTRGARIFGGQNAVLEQFPWQAAINTSTGTICGGAVISESRVLTSASCVTQNGVIDKNVQVILEVTDLNGYIDPKNIYSGLIDIHPDYGVPNKLSNNIAVISLFNRPTTDLRGLCIPTSDFSLKAYKNATLLGYGTMKRLQSIELDVLDNSDCTLIYPSIDKKELCASGELLKGPCVGDIGGPLVYYGIDGVSTVIGILSHSKFVLGCGILTPSVYTRVSEYNDFIKIVVNADELCEV